MADDKLSIVKEEPLRIVGMVQDGATQSQQPSTNTGLAMSATGESIPAASGLLTWATKPNVINNAGTIAKFIGDNADLRKPLKVLGNAAKAMSGYVNRPAAISPSELSQVSSRVSQAFGPASESAQTVAQQFVAPVQKVLTVIAPYAQSLATLGGAQSLLDLAQVAEPNRQDIGTLGVSVGTPRSDAEKTAHPALLNMLAGKVQEGIQALMHYGLSREDAVKAIGNQTAPTDNHGNDPSWLRSDGTAKGNGFLGVLKRPDGKVSSEISVGVNIGGKEIDIPTLVPTLTAAEKNWLLTNDVSDPSRIPKAIIQKAVDYARPRIAAGKSPFAGPGESPR